MLRRPIVLLVLAMLCWVPQVASAQTEVLDTEVASLVESRIAASPDPRADHDELWRATRIAHGHVSPLIRHLEKVIEGADGKRRLAALRLLEIVQRRDGRLAEALASIDRIEASELSTRDRVSRAEVLDALGRSEAARAEYAALLSGALPDDLRKTILLRSALMEKESAAALARFVKEEGRTPGQRNQAAVILALLDDQQSAIEIFEVEGESTARFRREVRLAEWAIECSAFDAAQGFAWAAWKSAKLRRDQRYALTLIASAYRRDDAVSELLDRLASMPEMSSDARQLWVRLLREEGRVEDALRLFREGEGSEFTAPMRRQLLEICRETGREDVLVGAFEDLILRDPDNLEWRTGLSRFHLESGDREAAVAVWKDFSSSTEPLRLVDAAFSLQDVGLDDVAERLARMASRESGFEQAGLLFVFKLHLNRGTFDAAETTLRELAQKAPPEGGVRAEIADGYERIGRPDLAVSMLEGLREARGGFLGTDLEMRFAILLSKVEREEDALAIWRKLWVRLRTSPRARFVEDRMMTVASRLGSLARIAIELEDRLAAGSAEDQDIDLLVRLYIKVGDPASATEILEEYMRRQGEADLEAVKRKSKIYLACQDYFNYERLVLELVEKDAESRLDHLRELAMCQLERGRRDLAIELLPRIREASGADVQIADEFEAGIYGIVGMKAEALSAYLKGMGRHPERIDTYLLISNLLRDTGEEMRAVRMFQYMAQTAERDDLFTIAIDGILNLRAPRESGVPDQPVRWALRTTMERLAERPHRFFLYRLTADLAEELGELPLAIRALKAGLPVAGERRTAIMREIMSKCRALDPTARQVFGSAEFRPSDQWDASDYVMVGRRLLGQGEYVPPSIYMNLATVLMRQGDTPAAMRTFSRAAEFLEYAEVTREAARVLEGAGEIQSAMTFYRRLVATSPNDASLLLKVGNLEEELGRSAEALVMYRRGLDLIFARQARFVTHRDEEPDDRDPMAFLRGGSVDADTEALEKLVRGVLVTLPDRAGAEGFVEMLGRGVDDDLSALPEPDAELVLANFPRLASRVRVWRQIALTTGLLEEAAAFDRRLLRHFPGDRDLTKSAIVSRRRRGYLKAAQEVLRASPFAADGELQSLAGVLAPGDTSSLSVAAMAARIVPMLGRPPKEIRRLLEKVDTGNLLEADVASVPAVIAACIIAQDRETGERLVRAGLRHLKIGDGRDESLQKILGLANRLDPDLARSIFVEQAETRIAATPRIFYQLMQVEEQLGGDLLDGETARKILLSSARNADRDLGFGATELLGRVERERRPAVLRELYQSYPASKRAQLLTSAVGYLEGPLDASFEDWIARSLAADLKNGDTMLARLNLRVGRGAAGRPSPSLMLKVAATLDEYKPSVANVGIQIESLLRLDRREEALALFEAQAPRFFAEGYEADRARSRVVAALRDDADREALVEMISGVAAKGAVIEGLADFKFEVLALTPEYESTLLAALAAQPDDVSLLARAATFHAQQGHLAERAEVLERLAKLDAGNPTWARQLKSIWKSLRNPLAAARVEVADGARGGVPGAMSVISTASGPVVSGRIVGGPAERPEGPGAKIQKMITEGDEAGARRALRAHWRAFRGQRNIGYRPPFPMNLLLRYSSPGPFRADAKMVTIFGAIEEPPSFVAEEARLALRTLSGVDAASTRDIRSELLDIIAGNVAVEDRARVIGELGVGAHAGIASVDEIDLFLRLVASGEGDVQADDAENLAGRPEIPDAARLDLLGTLLARGGDCRYAGALFRLGILGAASDRLLAFERQNRVKKKVTELESVLCAAASEVIMPTIDDLIMASSSYLSAQAAGEAIEIWRDRLPVRDAAARALKVRHLLSTRFAGSGRSSVTLPTLLARTGATEMALEEAERLLCWSEDPDLPPSMRRRVGVHRRGLESMVADDGEWEDRAGWITTLAEHVLQWHDAERLRSPTLLLAVIAETLSAEGDSERARRFSSLASEAARGARDRLTLARLERALGNPDRADVIEEELLSQRRLEVKSIARVVKGLCLRDRDAGLAAGEAAAAYTLDPALLELLIAENDAAGRADRAAHWREVQAEAYPPKKEEEEPNPPEEKPRG